MKTFTAAISFIQPLEPWRRTARSAMASATRSAHIACRCSPFKDAEPVNEVNHEVTTQRIVFRVLGITGVGCLRYVTALLQNVINFET